MDKKHKERLKKALLLTVGVILAIVVFYLPLPLTIQAKIVLAITALAMFYWFFEVLPLHITALLASFLLIVLGAFNAREIFQPYFDPVIVLLLGGFVLAVALQKHKLDHLIAFGLVNRIGHSSKKILFGFMVVTAFLSMWISNTASTAVMLPIALVVLFQNKLKPLQSNFGKAFILGIAYAATVGGIATLIGSTPGPIAAKFLADYGITLTFTDWMFYGLPFVIIFLPIVWFVLLLFFKPEKNFLKVKKQSLKLNRQMKAVLAIFALTVFLWLTTSFHGISAPMVAVIPIILLYVFSLLRTKDFLKVNWPAIILIGGGLSLGTAITLSGLDLFFAGILQVLVTGQGFFAIAIIIIVFAIIMTVFASNTAAAAIMLPLMIPLANLIGINPVILVVLAGIGVSLDFVVPVGTPPSAIAYSSGYIRVKDMAKVGIVLAIIGTLVLSGLAALYW